MSNRRLRTESGERNSSRIDAPTQGRPRSWRQVNDLMKTQTTDIGTILLCKGLQPARFACVYAQRKPQGLDGVFQQDTELMERSSYGIQWSPVGREIYSCSGVLVRSKGITAILVGTADPGKQPVYAPEILLPYPSPESLTRYGRDFSRDYAAPPGGGHRNPSTRIQGHVHHNSILSFRTSLIPN